MLALGLVIAGLFNFFAPRIYESSASLYATAGGRQLRASDINQGTMMVEARMSTYVEIATSPVVLDKTIQELSLDETPSSLAERVTATNPPGTTILKITAQDPDPVQAQQIAATVATKFSDAVTQLESGTQATAQVDFPGGREPPSRRPPRSALTSSEIWPSVPWSVVALACSCCFGH